MNPLTEAIQLHLIRCFQLVDWTGLVITGRGNSNKILFGTRPIFEAEQDSGTKPGPVIRADKVRGAEIASGGWMERMGSFAGIFGRYPNRLFSKVNSFSNLSELVVGERDSCDKRTMTVCETPTK